MRIFTLTLLLGAILALAAVTMLATKSGWLIREQPMPSLIAQDCGQPQLRSTPLQNGVIISAARANSVASDDAN
jgi:hypothetical protein